MTLIRRARRLRLAATIVALLALFSVPSAASEQAHQEREEARTESEVPRVFDPQGPRLIYPQPPWRIGPRRPWLIDPHGSPELDRLCGQLAGLLAQLETLRREAETKQFLQLPLWRPRLGESKRLPPDGCLGAVDRPQTQME